MVRQVYRTFQHTQVGNALHESRVDSDIWTAMDPRDVADRTLNTTWARNPSPNACGYCSAQGSLESVNNSRVMNYGGTDYIDRVMRPKSGPRWKGSRYHDYCRCVAVAVRPGTIWKPDNNELTSKVNDAKQLLASVGGDPNNVDDLAWVLDLSKRDLDPASWPEAVRARVDNPKGARILGTSKISDTPVLVPPKQSNRGLIESISPMRQPPPRVPSSPVVTWDDQVSVWDRPASDTVKAIRQAQTPDEVGQMLTRRFGVEADLEPAWITFRGFDDDKLDLDSVKQVGESLTRLLETYADRSSVSLIEISDISDDVVSSRTFAYVQDDADAYQCKMVFNRDILRSRRMMRDTFQNALDQQWYLAGDADRPWEYITTHEFGHTIDSFSGWNSILLHGDVYRLKPLDDTDTPDQWLRKQLSGYAQVEDARERMVLGSSKGSPDPDPRYILNRLNWAEVWAEGFAQAEFLGDRANPVSRWIKLKAMNSYTEVTDFWEM